MTNTQQPNPVIKLVNINIEGHRHLDKVIPFLQAQQPDVVCLQEVRHGDLPMIEDALNMASVFAPLAKVPTDSGSDLWGIAILTGLKRSRVQTNYYFTGGREPGDAVMIDTGDQNTFQRALLSMDVQTDSGKLTLATTHFTWSPKGKADDLQRATVKSLMELLGSFEEIVFCGDFNAPRGGEIFAVIADKYADWVPADITTTLDQNLHKRKGLQYVVDSIFSSYNYRLTDFQVVSGVSDHCALVSNVERLGNDESSSGRGHQKQLTYN